MAYLNRIMKRLTKLLFILLAVLMLAFAGQQVISGTVLQKGPQIVKADEDDCANDPEQLGCLMPGTPEEPVFPGGEVSAPEDSLGPLNPGTPEEPIFPSEPTFQPVTPVSQEISAPTPMGPTLTYTGGDCEGNHSVWVHIFSDGTRVIQADHGVVPGECGNPISQPTLVSQPAPQQITFVDRVIGRGQPQTFITDNRSFTDSRSRTDSHNRTRIDDHSIRGSFNDSRSFTDSHDDSHNITTSTTTTTTNPTPVVITQPAVVTAQTEATCPSGTTKVISGSSITCVLPSTTQVVTTQVAPRVVTVAGAETKELPKTGLPLAGLALGALAPLGLRLKRFGTQSSSVQGGSVSSNFIWEERQLSRN